MGHYEDFWYNIHDSLDKMNLREEFDKQLKKMDNQDKHRYKDTRDRWSYAHDKVVKRATKKEKVQHS
jgi:hypothetical protein|tara:strand:- start:2353 stop:2553 length:201 start_codon:yes stop_codon:yes gene_type:complete